MVTPLSVLKKAKNDTFARKKNAATGLRSLNCIKHKPLAYFRIFHILCVAEEAPHEKKSKRGGGGRGGDPIIGGGPNHRGGGPNHDQGLNRRL